MDRIELSGMEFFGYHGCFAEERQTGQNFIVDAVLCLDLAEAGRTSSNTSAYLPLLQRSSVRPASARSRQSTASTTNFCPFCRSSAKQP